MRKATHNGTCQYCGRQQAASYGGTSLAKHGYTTEHGWFNGTCHGSDKAPLEIDASLLDAWVIELEERAAKLAATTPDQIVRVKVEWKTGGAWNRKTETRWPTNDAELTAALDEQEAGTCIRSYNRPTFADLQEREAASCRATAGHLREHAKMLGMLRAARHGQPLIPRQTEAPSDRCPGSGGAFLSRRGRYGECESCHHFHPVTSAYRVRAHRIPR